MAAKVRSGVGSCVGRSGAGETEANGLDLSIVGLNAKRVRVEPKGR